MCVFQVRLVSSRLMSKHHRPPFHYHQTSPSNYCHHLRYTGLICFHARRPPPTNINHPPTSTTHSTKCVVDSSYFRVFKVDDLLIWDSFETDQRNPTNDTFVVLVSDYGSNKSSRVPNVASLEPSKGHYHRKQQHYNYKTRFNTL